MQEITQLILKTLDLNGETQLKKPIRGLPGFNIQQLITALISTETVVEAAILLGYSDNPIKQCIRVHLHPVLPSYVKKRQWRHVLLFIVGYRFCTSCCRTMLIDNFVSDPNNTYGTTTECKSCKTARTKLYKISIADRVVPWTNKVEIREFYNNCPINCEVDHIIPLHGKIVSGLHVLKNLQYLDKQENRLKGNKFIQGV